MADSSDAVDKVFNTFELLEKVLTYVLADVPHSGSYYRLKHLKHLHRLQRVKSTFRDVIVRSKTIRVGTFHDQLQSKKEGGGLASGDQVDQPYTNEELELTTNPLLRYPEKVLSGLDYCWLEFSEGRPSTGVTFGVMALGAVELRKMSDSASWRGMLCANMPLQDTLTLEIHHKRAMGPKRRIELGERATLGEVADEMITAVRDIEEADRRSPRWPLVDFARREMHR